MERLPAHDGWMNGVMAALLLAPWLTASATQAQCLSLEHQGCSRVARSALNRAPMWRQSRRAALEPPAELSALASKGRLDGAIAAWCRGELRAGRTAGFAAAVSAPAGGGRYVVLEEDGSIAELGAYKGQPELSCYNPAEARRLNDTIRQSQTIHGEVTPRWDTAVICGFVEETSAVCWQHSPAGRAFVKVGGWVT